MKNLLFAFLFSLIATSCYKTPIVPPAPLPEKWALVLSFQHDERQVAFNLASSKIGNFVGNYNEITGKHDIVGKFVHFKGVLFTCEVWTDLSGNITEAHGYYKGVAYRLHFDDNTISFCDGARTSMTFTCFQTQ